MAISILKKLFGGRKNESSQYTNLPINLDGSRGDIIIQFQNSIQEPLNWKKLKNVEFAMWFPCEQDKLFASSPIVDKWSAVYSLTKNYWSYISADLLKTLKLVDENTFRLSLPDKFQTFAFLTADGEQIILSLSREKGIRLHFAKTTALEYRALFMDKFISYCNAWKDLIELNNGPKDDDMGFAEWWSLAVKTSTNAEENEPVLAVGKIAR